MEILKDILLAILILSASALCIALIFYLKKITNSVHEIKDEIGRLGDKMEPLIESVQTLSSSLTRTNDDIQEQLSKTGWIIDQVKMRLESLFGFEEKVRDSFESPVEKLLANLTALKGGVLSFFKVLFFKNKGDHQ